MPLPDARLHLMAARQRIAQLAGDLRATTPGSATQEHVSGRLREALDDLDAATARWRQLAAELHLVIDQEYG